MKVNTNLYKKNILLFPLILFMALPSLSAVESIKLWHCAPSPVNDRMGMYNVFQKEPSFSEYSFNYHEKYGNEGYSLHLEGIKSSEGGYSGFWMQLFDTKSENQVLINAGPEWFLSFRIKGKRGSPLPQPQLADALWLLKEDSLPAKPLSNYLEGSTFNGKWQEVKIPLSDFTGINPDNLAVMAFNFINEGKYDFYVDQIFLIENENQIIHEETIRSTDKALWVWKTEIIIDNSSNRLDFVKELVNDNFNLIFLQIPRDKKGKIIKTSYLGLLIRELHKNNIQVHALDGDARWASASGREGAVQSLNAILEYNRSQPDNRKFDGIHFDIEPHGLPGFIDPSYKMELYKNSLDLSRDLYTMAASHNLKYGMDIPFWLDTITMEYEGRNKKLSEHFIDSSDNTGLMGYRNYALGEGGIIEIDQSEIDYGSTMNKKIYAGFETFRYPELPVSILPSLNKAVLISKLSNDLKYLRDEPVFMGFSIRLIESDERIFPALSREENMSWQDEADFHNALKKWMNLWKTDTVYKNDSKILKSLAEKSEQWSSLSRKKGYYELVSSMLPVLTFEGRGKEYLNTVMRDVKYSMILNPGYAGNAVHYYSTYRKME